MIVNCLIRRVEVYRDYKLHIDFNIDFTQFSLGLDIVEIAAYNKQGLLQNRPKKKRQAGQPEKGCLACLFALGLVCEHKTKARPV